MDSLVLVSAVSGAVGAALPIITKFAIDFFGLAKKTSLDERHDVWNEATKLRQDLQQQLLDVRGTIVKLQEDNLRYIVENAELKLKVKGLESDLSNVKSDLAKRDAENIKLRDERDTLERTREDLQDQLSRRLNILASEIHRLREAAGNPPGKGQPPRRRVLVVDDNRDAADGLEQLLTTMGMETAVAYDGLEAIEAAAMFRPNTILLDIGMPGLNGYDVCRRIRSRPWGDGVSIIACTAWGQDEDFLRSREAGFNHHLVKPLDLDALKAILQEDDRDATEIEVKAQADAKAKAAAQAPPLTPPSSAS